MPLIKAMTSSFGARLLMAGLNYGLFWVLSHRLGGAELGGFSLLMNVFYLLQTLPLLGLATPLTRRIATEPQHLAEEMSTAMAVALPVAAALALGCGLTGEIGYPDFMHGAFWLLAAGVIPSAWILVIEVTLIGREQMSTVARVQALEALGRTVASVAVVLLGGSLSGLFAVFLAGRLLAALVYLKTGGLPRPRRSAVRRELWRRNWAEVPVFLGIGLLAAVAGRIDLIVLSRMAGLEAAGQYAAAARLYEAALMLPTVAAMVILPSLARLYMTDRERFATVLGQSLRACLVVGLAVALAIAALAQPVIDLLYAAHLREAGVLLQWLIFGAVLMTLDQMLSSTMIAAHAQKEDLRTLVLAVGGLLVFLVVGISLWGPLGAAIAVPASLAVRVAWRLRWLMSEHAVPGLPSQLLRTVVAAAGAGVALHFSLPMGSWFALPITLGLYVTLCVVLGVLRRHHLAFFKPLIQRIRPRSHA